MRCLNFIMIAAAALLLSGCSTTLQVYSFPEHETLRLRQGDLRDGGLAFLTPSTVTGQEEDKQSLAHVFAATLQSERPELRFVSLSETISAVNRAGLAEAYRTMYQNYRDTGVFDGAPMRRVAQAAQVRYLAQLKLANMQQGAKGRWSLLGLNILQTQYAHLRVFFQIWDSRDGSIAWEGMHELRISRDTTTEEPITMRVLLERSAQELVAKLP